MLRRLLLPLALAGVSLAVVSSASAGATKSRGLVGEVGPGYTIEVSLNGKDVKRIKAGTYRIKIEDKASFHDFHLIGKGLNKATTVAFTGERTWTIRLRPGTYTYQCDPHASQGMKGTFTVTK
jgi:plastocyanin